MVETNSGEVRVRLQQSALTLFAEHGYDGVTAAAIAAHAGVTERTFFRYFRDKREVLFDGEAILRAALVAAIVAAPEGLKPLDILLAAFRTVVPLLEGNRAFAKPRQAVIAGTPALFERELAKMAALGDALAAALQARGVTAEAADLAARTGMTAFATAIIGWFDAATPGLDSRLDTSFGALRALLA